MFKHRTSVHMLPPPNSPVSLPDLRRTRRSISLGNYVDYDLKDDCSFLSEESAETYPTIDEKVRRKSFNRILSAVAYKAAEYSLDPDPKDTSIITTQTNLSPKKKVNTDCCSYSLLAL